MILSKALTTLGSSILVSVSQTKPTEKYETETSEDDSNSSRDNSNSQTQKYHWNDVTIRSESGILTFLTSDISLGLSSKAAKIKQDANKARDQNRDRRLRLGGASSFSVRFADIVVREYPYEIGDNPASMKGPALSMTWKHVKEESYSITEYEEMNSQRARRTTKELVLPASIRTKILREAGYGRLQIIQETKIVNIIRRQRQQTLQTLKMSHLYEMKEHIGRQTMNILTLGKRNQQETKFLKHAEVARKIIDSDLPFTLT